MRRRMPKGTIRIASCLALVLPSSACNVSRDADLLDGCYYLGEKPILSVRGTEGSLLIPGDISRFRLVPQGSSDHIWMTTQPSFAIGGGDRKYVKAVVDSPSPSPLVIIDDENPAASRILVLHNGQIARLAHQDSCTGALAQQR